jgi:hypothetical protein
MRAAASIIQLRRLLVLVVSAVAVAISAVVYLSPYHLKPSAWITAQDVRDRVHQAGAKQAVFELSDDDWGHVVLHLAEGRPEWLEPRQSSLVAPMVIVRSCFTTALG